jgi:hypothetical protein
MDDLLAKLHAGPTGNLEQDGATMQRAAHEIQWLQAQLENARSLTRTGHHLRSDEYHGKEPVIDPSYGWSD